MDGSGGGGGSILVPGMEERKENGGALLGGRQWESDEDEIRSVVSEDRVSACEGWEESEFFDGGVRRSLKRAVPRVDSLDVEAMEVSGITRLDPKDVRFSITLCLAFKSIGIVYGDMGTSPLYVYSNAFNRLNIDGSEDILGALSIIIYTITLIPFIKYVLIVLRANNNGEGGTLSLYSLICRYAKVSLLPNREPADEQISNFKVQVPTKRLDRALKIKEKLETCLLWKNLLFIVVLIDASFIIGDGILTPCISVMSAASGLKVAMPYLNQDVMVAISLLVLILLFSLQRFGTGKVGFLFGPILSIWFAAIAMIGVYNIVKYDPGVFRAFNPACIYFYFKRNMFKAWYSLGGLVLCITGGEAMFADLGHFSVRAIQIAFCCLVYPCLLLAYMGQAAYLVKHPSDLDDTFYKSIPAQIFWPVFIIAISAAMIASQAMISATFSLIKMALAMEGFPRVKVIHTSKQFMGQIYVPMVNWFLMIMCLIITFTFKTTTQIGNAYGIVAIGDMLVTTSLVTLIMLMIWQTSFILALTFTLIIGSVELLFLSAILYNVDQGGWVPLALTVTMVIIMCIWHYGNRMKYQSEVEQDISMDYLLQLGSNLGTIRVPGVGLLYTDLVRGVPAFFGYFIRSLPAIHSTLVFVCIKYVPVPIVPQSQRFLFRRLCPREYHLFRCVARYGYKDIRKEDHFIFEQLLILSLEAFICQEAQDYALENENFAITSDCDLFPGDNSSLSYTSEPLKEPLLFGCKIQKQVYPFARAVERSSGFDSPTNVALCANIRLNHAYIDSIAAEELACLCEAKKSWCHISSQSC
eukprot:c26681_g1_i1 orf=98-2524(+)